MVTGLQGTYLEKCKELGFKTLEERRNGLDMALVHKFLTEGTGTKLIQRTTTQQRSRTRQATGEQGFSVQYARKRLLGGTSLKLAFLQTGAQHLAGDISTSTFRPIVPL
jgi:hypothetical protein